MALTKAGRTDEALPHFTEAVGEAAAHYNIGRMLVESGKTGAAEQEFVLALTKDPTLTDAQYFLDEIRSNAEQPAQSAPIAVRPNSAPPVTQRVSGTAPTGRPTVTPATNSTPQIRPATYPHSGYEELPPPPDMMEGASSKVPPREKLSPITQVGYSPVATTGQPILTPPSSAPVSRFRAGPMLEENQIRLSSTRQFPLGR